MIAVEKTKRVKLSELKPYPKNPRRGDVAAIVESLEAHGQYRALVVNARTNEVLAGNHTFRALEEMGASEALVHFVDVDEDEAARIVLVDNRSNDVAGYDDMALLDLLRSLPDLDGTGYSDGDLDRMLTVLAAAGRPDTSAAEPPAEPRTKPGDLWLLGEHRLLCGDSSDPLALDRVFSGVTVGCVLTDPPYGMNLDTDYSQLPGGNAKSQMHRQPKKYRRVAGDDQPFDASFLRAYFAGAAEQFWFGADYYRRTLSESDLDGSWLVWDKRDERTDDVIGSSFETCWSAQKHKRRMLRHYWNGAFGNPEARGRSHPTQKPTSLLADILTHWAPEGCVVADPFLGSGSTLIACEQTGRTCHGLELDPGYCDVIVDRWERHTGKKAKLDG